MIDQARFHFPSGLFQPPGSFRFSADALALANFGAEIVQQTADPATQYFFADLGTGCGVVGLALLLRVATQPGCTLWRGVGVDCDPDLVNAASHNAAHLGLEHMFQAVQGDMSGLITLLPAASPVGSSDGFSAVLTPHCADMVLFNPPWRLEGTGLLPPSPIRRKALFGTANTLHLFAKAAALLLKPTGRACSVMSTERKKDQRAALLAADLHIVRECPVVTKPGAPPPFVLFEAVPTPS